jgi:hypothetical protein
MEGFSTPQYTERTGGPPPCKVTTHWVACQLTGHQLQMCLGDYQQTKQSTFLLEPHLVKKKEDETKLLNLNPKAVKSFSTPCYT